MTTSDIKSHIIVREYQLGDEQQIAKLFYETVHHINRQDYSKEQLNAWAPANIDVQKWQEKFSNSFAYVAIDKNSNKIVGFADLKKDGLLDHGYVDKDHQRQGIGSMLLKIRENKARQLGLKKVFANISVTAKQFFIYHGYSVGEANVVSLRGMNFVNYPAVKEL